MNFAAEGLQDSHKLSMNDRRGCKLCPRAVCFGKPEKLERTHCSSIHFWTKKGAIFFSRLASRKEVEIDHLRSIGLAFTHPEPPPLPLTLNIH